jgi:hypothetical protein
MHLADGAEAVNGNTRRQKAGAAKKKPRPPVFIVHLDDGGGRPLCSLPEPWPSQGHRMATVGNLPQPQDVCLTCAWERDRKLTLLR